jgi:hypothetical protein
MAGDTSVHRFEGRDLIEENGSKIGKIDRVFAATDDGIADDANALGLIRLGLLGTSWHFVPLAGASDSDEGVVVPYTKDFIKQGPPVLAEGDVSSADLEALHSYYGTSDTTRLKDAPGTSPETTVV